MVGLSFDYSFTINGSFFKAKDKSNWLYLLRLEKVEDSEKYKLSCNIASRDGSLQIHVTTKLDITTVKGKNI